MSLKHWVRLPIRNYKLVFADPTYSNLFVLSVAISLLSSMLGPVFPIWIVRELHESASSVFFILAGIGLGGAALNLLIGHLSDRIGKRKLIIQISLALSAIKALLYAFFPYPWVVIGASCLTQFSNSALIFAILDEKIKRNGHEDITGIITSTVRSAVSIGFIFGPWLGITIAALVSFKHFFFVYGLLYIALFLATRYSLHDESTVAKINQQFRRGKGNFVLITTISISIIALFSGSSSSGPLLALSTSKLASTWYVAAVFGVGPVFEIVVFPLVGMINDRIGPFMTIMVGAVAEILYFLMLYSTKNVIIILIVQIFGTFYTAVIFTSLMIYVQKLFPERIGFSSSLFFSSTSISSVIGQLLLGSVLLRGGFNSGFLVLGSLAALGLCTIFLTHYISKSVVC